MLSRLLESTIAHTLPTHETLMNEDLPNIIQSTIYNEYEHNNDNNEFGAIHEYELNIFNKRRRFDTVSSMFREPDPKRARRSFGIEENQESDTANAMLLNGKHQAIPMESTPKPQKLEQSFSAKLKSGEAVSVQLRFPKLENPLFPRFPSYNTPLWALVPYIPQEQHMRNLIDLAKEKCNIEKEGVDDYRMEEDNICTESKSDPNMKNKELHDYYYSSIDLCD